MSETTNLSLPLIDDGSRQGRVNYNEAVTLLDHIVYKPITSKTTTAQPASPTEGALYVIPAGATGTDWAGFAEDDLAYYANGAWYNVTPKTGWGPFKCTEDDLSYIYDGANWVLSASYYSGDHGLLSGLADDDHSQYLHEAPTDHTRNLVSAGANASGLQLSATGTLTSHQLVITDPTAALNEKSWGFQTYNGNTLDGACFNDALSNLTPWLTVTRSGQTPTSTQFPYGTVLVSEALQVGGAFQAVGTITALDDGASAGFRAGALGDVALWREAADKWRTDDWLGLGISPSSVLELNAADSGAAINLLTWGVGGAAGTGNIKSRLCTHSGMGGNRGTVWSSNFNYATNVRDDASGTYGSAYILINPNNVNAEAGSGINFYTGLIADATPSLRLNLRQDGALAFNNPSVAHGMTALAPTTVNALIEPVNALGGGMQLTSLTDADYSSLDALVLRGINGWSSPSGSSIRLYGGKKNGTGWQALSATEKVLQVTNYTADLFTILGNGNVGIGDVAAADNLSIVESNADTTLGNLLGPAISMRNGSNTVNNYSAIRFNSYGGNVASAIYGVTTDQANAYGDVVIANRNAGGYFEHLRVASTGTVKIASMGLDTATVPTTEAGFSLLVGKITNTTGNYGAAIGVLDGTVIPAGILFVDNGASAATDFSIFTGNASAVAERFRIKSTGNTGILQSSPQTALHIGGALTLDEIADPSDPAEGDGVLWVSTAGELKYKTRQGGTVTAKTVATIP